MKQKENVLNQLQSMGFDPIEIPGLGHRFEFEDVNYLYMPDDDDERFLRIAIPRLLDVTDANRVAVLNAMQETGQVVKYSKVCMMYEAPWAIYEHRLSSSEDLDDLLEHIIHLLKITASLFCKKAMGEDIDFPSDESETDIDDELDAELQKLFESMGDMEEYE